MKTFVLDVAAESGGAWSVLRSFYDRFDGDGNEYVFCVSREGLEDTRNIRVLRCDRVKKSRLHRLFFDYFVLPGLIKKSGCEKVLSLQNIAAPRTKLPQTVYLHQALPYCEKRYSLRDEPGLWLYQHPIARLIKKSLVKADRVIVQTEWMKRAVVEKDGIYADKIVVERYSAPDEAAVPYDGTRDVFFYPADHYVYKDHLTLLRACAELKDEEFRLILTIDRSELKEEEARLADELGGKLELTGRLTFERVLGLYSKSVLVFPSLVETCALPLYEARSSGAPIIAADLPYAREALSGYDRANFFGPEDPDSLAGAMRRFL
ncbi:MAG: glycosyltransferase [Clostridia bacterium]|nr:glycosyltransferase [Clostridia bacterium]